MPDTNPGPASTSTPNQIYELTAPVNPLATFATLPVDYRTLPGSVAYTSDAGQVIWNGSIWAPISGANQFIPATLTTIGIQAAINAAQAAGGGSVLLPPQTITLQGPLILAQNVSVTGTGWYGQPGSGLQLLGGGTILQGNGTFDCFDYNPTDLGAPYGTAQQLANSLLQSPSVQNLSMTNFVYGIKAGALYQGGVQNGYFFNLYATNCSAWGMWFENFGSTLWDRCLAIACNHGIGFFASGTNLYNFGNSTIRRSYGGNNTANGQGRGVAIQARVGSQFNNMNAADMSAGGAAFTSTQAATMQSPAASVITNTSANIAVTNTCVANEIVQFSVAVGTGGNGVATGTNYYVIATGLSGSNIQVSATLGGTAITFNASGTPNVNFCKIGVTDMTKVGVGIPVHFSATVNNVTINQTYFALTTSGNTSGAGWITIAGALGGNTVAAGLARASSGSSAVNAIFNGWPNFEAGGMDQTSFVTYLSTKGNMDVEGGNAPRIVLNGVQGADLETGIIQSAGPVNTIVVAQSTQVQIKIMQPGINILLDALSQIQTLIWGAAPVTGAVQGGLGFKLATAGRASINLTDGLGTGVDDIALMPTLFQLQLNNALALLHSQQGAGVTLATANGNLITYTGAVGTLTLPNLSAVTMVGWQFWVSNPGASTLTVSATQNIVGLGVSGTSVSVLTLQTALFVAHNNAGTMYWAQYK